MLDHAKEAIELSRGRSREDLDKDRLFNLALVRLLEVVGEAPAHIPEDFRQQHPEVPWREISDLRNRLIHGYDTVNFDVLWAIVKQDLPPLVDQLTAILEEEA
jgi:uncharacterized protein with HEPN domain